MSSNLLKLSSPSPNVVHVELARKPVNAFNEEFWMEFGRVFDEISRRTDVRVVVLSSSLPKVFTAGLDLTETGTLTDPAADPGRKAMVLRDHILHFQHAISAVERCRFPVIVAIHGIAFGLAIDMTAACDIRYAASDTVFSIKEVDVGLAADIGTLARLPKSVANDSFLRELAYTGRNFSAEEAFSLGFVSKVVKGGQKEVVEAAMETAKVIAGKSPVAVMGTKRLLLHARDHSVDDNLEYTATWNAFALQAKDSTAAMHAFKTKKHPSFEPLPPLRGKL